MSYVTYSPGIEAPLPERARRSRWWRVPLGLLIYAGLCALFIWWLKQPPPIKPPLASIPLPDGTELRLLGTRSARQIQLDSSDDFGGRLRTDDYSSRRYGHTTWGDNAQVEKPQFIVSRFIPNNERFTVAAINEFEVIEAGTAVAFPGKLFDGSSDYPVSVVSFSALPRRERELTVRFKYGGATVTGKLQNPFVSSAAPFVAMPLPKQIEKDGFVFELRGVKVREESETTNNGVRKVWKLAADARASAVVVPDATIHPAATFFDATGNESGHNMLPTADRVWGVRITAREGSNFPFPPEQVESLGKIKFPGPGQGVPLAISQKLKDAGVAGIFALGQGSYQLNYATKGVASLRHNSSGKNSEIGTVPITGLSSGASVGQLGVWAFAQTDGKRRHGGDLRIRHKGKLLNNSGGGSSTRNNTEARHYSFDLFPAPVPVGEEIEIEFVYPRERKVEFYFERPKLPGEK